MNGILMGYYSAMLTYHVLKNAKMNKNSFGVITAVIIVDE